MYVLYFINLKIPKNTDLACPMNLLRFFIKMISTCDHRIALSTFQFSPDVTKPYFEINPVKNPSTGQQSQSEHPSKHDILFQLRIFTFY